MLWRRCYKLSCQGLLKDISSRIIDTTECNDCRGNIVICCVNVLADNEHKVCIFGMLLCTSAVISVLRQICLVNISDCKIRIILIEYYTFGRYCCEYINKKPNRNSISSILYNRTIKHTYHNQKLEVWIRWLILPVPNWKCMEIINLFTQHLWIKIQICSSLSG